MTDAVEVSRRRITDAGMLVADAVFARTGIQQYAAGEIKAPGRKPGDVLNVLRPASEVFKQVSLDTFRSVPITDNHPSGLVTADNSEPLSVGITGPEISKDAETVTGTIQITKPSAVKRAQDGKIELSAGYTCVYDFTGGTTEDGDSYDAVQRDIQVNHIAMVEDGRCGPVCAIADSKTCTGDCSGCTATGDSIMRTVTIDGIGYELEDGVAQAVNDKLQKLTIDMEEAKKKADDMEEEEEKKASDMEKMEGEKDAALAEVETLKAKALDAATIDSLVESRTQVVSDARRLHPKIETAGKTNEAIRREVVTEKIGGTGLDEKSDAYIEARFDALAEGGGESNRFAQRNLDGANADVTDPATKVQTAYDNAVDYSENAWKRKDTAA